MIPISKPSLTNRERTYMLDAFDSGWISSRGAYVDRAENQLEGLTGMEHASLVSSGTAALHLALLAVGVGPGDEVVIPATTYVATLNAVLYTGATPVIVDVEPSTWTIDARRVGHNINRTTKAVVAVDIYGNPADYAAIRRELEGSDVAVIADAAESIGARIGQHSATQFADVAVFSFFGNKIVTCGEGGATLTNDSSINDTIRQLRNQGNHPTRAYHHEVVGYNYRLPNTSAAILSAQIERLDELLAMRERVVDRYRQAVETEPLLVPQEIRAGTVPSPWMFSVTIEDCPDGTRDRVRQALDVEGIETRPVFEAMPRMPFMANHSGQEETPVADHLAHTGISLPTFAELSTEQIDWVVETLTRVIRTVAAGP